MHRGFRVGAVSGCWHDSYLSHVTLLMVSKLHVYSTLQGCFDSGYTTSYRDYGVNLIHDV